MNPSVSGFQVLYPNVTIPLINTYLGGAVFPIVSGTAQAIAAGNITLAATVTTGNRMSQTDYDKTDAVKGMFVYIYSATTGTCQYKKITAYDYTTRVASLESNWGITPTGTVVYRIVDNEYEVYFDRASEIMIKTHGYLIASSESLLLETRLTDFYGTLNATGTIETQQDTDYLFGDFMRLGKEVFLAKSVGGI